MSSCPSIRSDPQCISNFETMQISIPYWKESEKPLYQVDQQVKFLHLAAEVESLWQELQSINQQRQHNTNIQSCQSVSQRDENAVKNICVVGVSTVGLGDVRQVTPAIAI